MKYIDEEGKKRRLHNNNIICDLIKSSGVDYTFEEVVKLSKFDEPTKLALKKYKNSGKEIKELPPFHFNGGDLKDYLDQRKEYNMKLVKLFED